MKQKFFFFQNTRTDSGPHPAYNSMTTGIL